MARARRPATHYTTESRYKGKMSKAILEKPAPKKAASPRPATPFHYEASGVPGWLGCPPIWKTPPSFPSRIRCQRDVLNDEREAAAGIVSLYRGNEKIASDHDLGMRQNRLDESAINPMRRLTPLEIQTIRKEMVSCDHQQHIIAQSELNELRESAADLASLILQRLIISFDEELNERAWEAEDRLTKDFIPLKNGDDYGLWRMPDVVNRHAWREIARNWLKNLSHENSVGAIQWLASSEEHVPQPSWM